MTENRNEDRSIPAGANESRHCCICGKMVTIPRKALSLDGKEYCDACYRDCFFAEMGSNRHLALDCCAI